MGAAGQQDALLDGLALVEACLRGDGPALSLLLDTGDNRAQASLLADLLAKTITALHPEDPLAAAAYLRYGLITQE